MVEKDDGVRLDLSNVEEFKIAEPEWGREINVAAEGLEPFLIREPLNELAVEQLGSMGNGILALHHRLVRLEEMMREVSK